RLEYGAAIAPCGHGRATAHRRGRSNAQARSLTVIGVATFAATPIGGASNIAQPARSQLDLGVAVQRRIECDVVTGWVDVSLCQPGEWQGVALAFGFFGVEIYFRRFW